MILYELNFQEPEIHISRATYFPSLAFAFKIRCLNLFPSRDKRNRRDVICYTPDNLFPQTCSGDKQEVANAKNRCKSSNLYICIHITSIDADFFSNYFPFQHSKQYT